MVALTLGAPAGAFIAQGDRIGEAVARTNRASGRAQPLQLSVELYLGGLSVSEPSGRGTLVVHPNGLARLELHGPRGLIERHLLLGSEHRASRNGFPLASPRAFLPPLFLLQIDSPVVLEAALAAMGADPAAVSLAPCGDSDCLVLGDPARVPPPPAPSSVPEEVIEDRAVAAPPPLPGIVESTAPLRQAPGATRAASLWIDVTSYQVRGIESRDGVRVRLGPLAIFEQVRVPSWILIEEPGQQPVRFQVLDAMPVDAPAAAFGASWLVGEERPLDEERVDPGLEIPQPFRANPTN